MEVYVLIEKRRNIIAKICAVIFFILGAISFMLLMIGAAEFLLMAVAFLLVGWFLYTGNYEYEYSYFDGEFRFAKIRNKSRRKELKGYTADELIIIAPVNDRAVYQYVSNTKLKTLDYTSGDSEAKVYVMVAKDDAGISVIKYEPDEKYLEAVCIKYGQKVIR